MIAKIDTFRKILLDHEDLASSKLYVSYKMISNNHFKILRICIFAGKYLPPFHEIFFVQKIPIQKCFDHICFYLSIDFKNFCYTF